MFLLPLNHTVYSSQKNGFEFLMLRKKYINIAFSQLIYQHILANYFALI